jgi:hypothetical protein
VGGDRLDYSGDVTTSTADITTFKILINNTRHDDDGHKELLYGHSIATV